jgi:hypothetical protein
MQNTVCVDPKTELPVEDSIFGVSKTLELENTTFESSGIMPQFILEAVFP